MKLKIFSNFFVLLFIGTSAFAQDTSANQNLSKDQTYPVSTPIKNYNVPQKKQVYRDTRLGSSSRKYNTYRKNDNGAGAITTNPHKSGGNTQFPHDSFDSSSSNNSNKIYNDTRLGSSSPTDSTYQTNNNGAGAVTTDPDKR